MTASGGPYSGPGPGPCPTEVQQQQQPQHDHGLHDLDRQRQQHGPLLTSIWSWLVSNVPYKSNSLRGKRVLVSGSGGGLGRELSLQLVQQGCKVICVDLDELQVQETLGLVQLQQADAALQQGQRRREAWTDDDGAGGGHGGHGAVADVARGYACNWRNPGEALGLSRAVTSTEGGVDLIFVVPEANNNNESAVDSTGKIVGNEFWPLLGFLPGMLARARGHVVHVLDEQIAHKTGLVADAWIESLQEVGADVRYTKVHLHADQARYRPCRAEDAARSIVSAVRQGSTEVHIAYPIC